MSVVLVRTYGTPKSTCVVERSPHMLMPALRVLAGARSAWAVRLIFDTVPTDLHGAVAAYMASRPNMFHPVAVAEAVKAAGGKALKQVLGRRRASNVLTRYGAALERAVCAGEASA